MERRWRTVLNVIVVLPIFTASGCAQPTLLCRRPEVLQEVERLVRQQNVYNEVDANSAAEAPTSRANAVVCEAAVASVGYEPIPGGWQPRPIRLPAQYRVQVSGNRFFVQMLP